MTGVLPDLPVWVTSADLQGFLISFERLLSREEILLLLLLLFIFVA